MWGWRRCFLDSGWGFGTAWEGELELDWVGLGWIGCCWVLLGPVCPSGSLPPSLLLIEGRDGYPEEEENQILGLVSRLVAGWLVGKGHTPRPVVCFIHSFIHSFIAVVVGHTHSVGFSGWYPYFSGFLFFLRLLPIHYG